MIHGYGSKADQTWINMDQRGSSAFSLFLQPSACRRRPDSWLMCHGSWLMCHASHASGVMRPTLQASGVRLMAHASCVRLMRHASGVRLMAHTSGVRLMAHASHSRGMRQTHGSCVMRPASGSWLIRPASDSWLMCQASGVRRPASLTPRPIQPIQPPPVVGHDDNTAAAFPSCYPLQICAH